MKRLTKYMTVIGTVVTCVTPFIAAGLFFMRGEYLPRANSEITLDSQQIGTNAWVILVRTKIINAGNVSLELNNHRLVIWEILPVSPDVENAIYQSRPPEYDEKGDLPLTAMVNNEWIEHIVLRPGEEHTIEKTSLLPYSTKVIRVGLYHKRKAHELAWSSKTIFKLNEEIK